MDLPGLSKYGSLAEVESGASVTVINLDELPGSLRHSLLAYGIVPGRPVRVIARSPLVVVQVEHTELALETEIARAVRVSSD